jgi:hypothetical protein
MFRKQEHVLHSVCEVREFHGTIQPLFRRLQYAVRVQKSFFEFKKVQCESSKLTNHPMIYIHNGLPGIILFYLLFPNIHSTSPPGIRLAL